MAKETDWRALVLQADPEHVQKQREIIEYEFTSPGGSDYRANSKTHEGGHRVFRGDTRNRGPYAS